MAAELKARKDMDKRYMWDLTQIYKTNEDWEKAFVELQARIPEVGRYSGTMGTPAGAKAALDGFYNLVYKSMLMYLYAELNKSGDNGDPEYQAMNERAMMLLVQLNTAASYITPELATLPTETLQAYLHAPELELYRHQIADIIRVRKHVSNEWMIALSGVLAIVLGVLLAAFPLAGLIAAMVWIGIGALVYGVLQIAAGLRLCKF